MPSAPPFSGLNCCRSPTRKEVSNLLRRYVEVRLEFYAAGSDQKKLSEVRDKTERLHNQLWALGVAVGEKDPGRSPPGYFSSP